MQNNPLVSVIIPCYNSHETIVECVNSVLCQTYKNFEIIIIDDGSTDNTLDVLYEHFDSYSQFTIKILTQTNRGPSSARNNGIRAANGQYIAFLDADDIWLPKKLEKQIQYFIDFPETVMVMGCKDRLLFNKPILTKVISIKQMLFRNYFYTSSVIVSKNTLASVGLFNTKQKYSEDYRLALLVVKFGRSVFLNEIFSKSISGKLQYGISGLSSKLLKMEMGELSNFWHLYTTRVISGKMLFICSANSLAKLGRRWLIVTLRKMSSKFSPR